MYPVHTRYASHRSRESQILSINPFVSGRSCYSIRNISAGCCPIDWVVRNFGVGNPDERLEILFQTRYFDLSRFFNDLAQLRAEKMGTRFCVERKAHAKVDSGLSLQAIPGFWSASWTLTNGRLSK